MKAKLVAVTLALAALACATQARAADDVLKAKGCLNCHDAAKKKMGPSFKDINAKGGKADELVAKLKSAKGHPKVNASEDEIKAAVKQMQSMK